MPDYKEQIKSWKSSKPQKEKKEKKGKASSGANTAQFQGKKAETIKKRIGHLRAKAEKASTSKKGIMTGGREKRVARFEKRIEKKTAQLGKAVGKYEAKQAKKAPVSSVA